MSDNETSSSLQYPSSPDFEDVLLGIENENEDVEFVNNNEDDELVRNEEDEEEEFVRGDEEDQQVESEDEVEEEDEEVEIVAAAAALQPFRFEPVRRPGAAAPIPNPVQALRVGNTNW